MQVTNKYGLPDLLVKAVSNDPHTRGSSDISVTQLIRPPQQVYLQEKHKDEIVEDVSDLIWSLSGSAKHYTLQLAASESDVVEQRFYWTDTNTGMKLSGQIDLFAEGVLTDFKETSVWSVKDAIENGKDDWEDQLNILAFLMHKNGIEVNRTQIVALCRDWRKNEAIRYENYPARAEALEQSLWTVEEQESFVLARMKLHHDAKHVGYRPCSDKERWKKEDAYAVMKKGRKSALRVLDTHEAAEDWMAREGKGDSIEHRPGEYVRCEYCNVSEFCEQYQGEQDG